MGVTYVSHHVHKKTGGDFTDFTARLGFKFFPFAR